MTSDIPTLPLSFFSHFTNSICECAIEINIYNYTKEKTIKFTEDWSCHFTQKWLYHKKINCKYKIVVVSRALVFVVRNL